MSFIESSQYREVMRPHGKEGQVQWDPQTRGGLGTDAAVGGLLCPRDVAVVGS